MHMPALGERTLTELDFSRLAKLLRGQRLPVLAQLLEATDVVDSREVDADVVTMYSQVDVVDLHTRHSQRLTLCYPPDAEPGAGFISVLSPVGAALLGLRIGAVARWAAPGGADGAARVEQLLFQPEASGDYTL